MDAPWVPWLWAGIGVLYLVLAYFSAASWGAQLWVTVLVAVVGIGFLVGGWLFWYASAHGKFLVWREVLAELRSPARVLDLGCGRGAVTIMTAQTFPGAQLTGVDLWRSIDQSGNSLAAAEANAEANGVADRIRFLTGDMTSLPPLGAPFDLVTASLSIHNIHSPIGRRTAIHEAWRALSPGGTIVIVDISRLDEYVVHLRALGAEDLTVRNAGWRMWWSGPWMATRILVATKPVSA